MGEAKRRKAAARAANTSRTSATGRIEVMANGHECFIWTRTQQDAIELQKRYLKTMNAASSVSYARRAAGYLMAFGMPKPGDKDRRPSNFGNPWTENDIALYRAAVLWLALRQHIPNTGQKVEDVFVGKILVVTFNGCKEQILNDTVRELKGESFKDRRDVGPVELGTPLPENQFQMMAAVLDHNHRLDPRHAVSRTLADLLTLAGKSPPHQFASDLIYVPRIPLDAAESDAMLRMLTVACDAINPSSGVRTYAGYTNEELSGGRPHVLVRR
jgi:hypothetical protein